MKGKNPIFIYELLLRPTIIYYGLWNQLQIDHDQEFELCNFVQNLFKNSQREHRKRILDADNVYAELCYRTVLAGT